MSSVVPLSGQSRQRNHGITSRFPGRSARAVAARAGETRTARAVSPKCQPPSGLAEVSAAGLLAAALEGVPLGAEGADVVAVGFAGLFVLDEHVEGMAGVGHLRRPVFAFGRAQ